MYAAGRSHVHLWLGQCESSLVAAADPCATATATTTAAAAAAAVLVQHSAGEPISVQSRHREDCTRRLYRWRQWQQSV
jgi:hypothetical protein